MPRNVNNTGSVMGPKPRFREDAGVQVARAMDTGADSGKRDQAGLDKAYAAGAHKMTRSKRKGGRKY